MKRREFLASTVGCAVQILGNPLPKPSAPAFPLAGMCQGVGQVVGFRSGSWAFNDQAGTIAVWIENAEGLPDETFAIVAMDTDIRAAFKVGDIVAFRRRLDAWLRPIDPLEAPLITRVAPQSLPWGRVEADGYTKVRSGDAVWMACDHGPQRMKNTDHGDLFLASRHCWDLAIK